MSNLQLVPGRDNIGDVGLQTFKQVLLNKLQLNIIKFKNFRPKMAAFSLKTFSLLFLASFLALLLASFLSLFIASFLALLLASFLAAFLASCHFYSTFIQLGMMLYNLLNSIQI